MHEPDNYECPFCRLQQGVHNEHNQPDDVVVVTAHAYARIAPKWWPGNAGADLVISREHHENLYDIPTEVGHAVWDLTQRVAVAMRSTYDCEGISTRQHNEPAGNQDVWHLHVHVFHAMPKTSSTSSIFPRAGSARKSGGRTPRGWPEYSGGRGFCLTKCSNALADSVDMR